MSKFKCLVTKFRQGEELLIREANSSDLGAFLSLDQSIVKEQIYYLHTIEESRYRESERREWWEQQLINPNYLLIVAEYQGQVIGQLQFCNGHKQRIAHTGEFGIGIQADYRGCGVGKALMQALIDWARQHPLIEKINLMVHDTNHRAIALYEKLGFKREGLRMKDLKYGDDHYVNTLMMGLELK